MSKSKYVVEKENESVVSKKKVKTIKGFNVKPNNKVKIEDMIDVEKMTLVDNGLIKSVINRKVRKNFEKLLSFYMILEENDDSSEGDWDLLLDEEEKFRRHFLAKYKEYLKEEEVKKILKKLDILKKKIINQKSALIQDELSNKKGKGR